MEHAEKMYLVSRHQMEQLQGRPPTIGTTAVSRLDDDMKTILQRTDLSEDDKIKLYNSVLQRFLRLTRQNDSEKDVLNLIQPPESFKRSPAEPEPATPPLHQDPTKLEILEGMGPRYKKNAELLLNKMKQHQDILGWDAHGTVLYKGSVVPGTNIVDLVKGVSHQRSRNAKYYPKGWNEFMSAMAEMNVPTALLGSNSVKEQLEKLKDAISINVVSTTKSTSAMSEPRDIPMSNPKRVLKFGEWLQ